MSIGGSKEHSPSGPPRPFISFGSRKNLGQAGCQVRRLLPKEFTLSELLVEHYEFYAVAVGVMCP